MTTKWINPADGLMLDNGLRYLTTTLGDANVRFYVVKNWTTADTTYAATVAKAITGPFAMTVPANPSSGTGTRYIPFPTTGSVAVTVATTTEDLGLACVKTSATQQVLFVTELTPDSALSVGNILEIGTFNLTYNQPT